MNESTIDLIDTGRGFKATVEDQELKIEYGLFALALANIDYSSLRTLFEEHAEYIMETMPELEYAFLVQHTDSSRISSSFSSLSLNEFCIIAIKNEGQLLYQPLYSLLDNGYLDVLQLKWIMNLFISEFHLRMSSESFYWNDKYSYIPPILINPLLRKYVESILLREPFPLENQPFMFRDMFDKDLHDIRISSSINIDKSGFTTHTYHIPDTLTYLLLDIHNYLAGKKTVKKCLACNRLFYPTRQSDRYCRLKHTDGSPTCNVIMHQKGTDDFAQLCKKARGYQNSCCHRSTFMDLFGEDFLRKSYDSWSTECTAMCSKFKLSNDIDGFSEWIEDTKFTRKNLQREFANMNLQAKKDSPT